MAKPIRTIKIVSDGTAVGTHIYDENTGVEIFGISYMNIEFIPGNPVVAHLDFVIPEVDTVAEVHDERHDSEDE